MEKSMILKIKWKSEKIKLKYVKYFPIMLVWVWMQELYTQYNEKEQETPFLIR